MQPQQRNGGKRRWVLSVSLFAAAIFTLAGFVPKIATAQDVMVIPENGAPVSTTLPIAPLNTMDSSSNTVVPTSGTRLVLPEPPDPKVAALPMYGKILELREPDSRPIAEKKIKNLPPERVVVGLPKPLNASKLTTDEEDAKLNDVIADFESRIGRPMAYPASYQGFIDFTAKHPDSPWSGTIKENLDAIAVTSAKDSPSK